MGWCAVNTLMEVGLAFIIGILSARYMGPANYGAVTVATVIVMFFQRLCSSGIRPALCRRIASDSAREAEWVAAGTSVIWRAVWFWFPILVICSFLLPHPYKLTTLLASFAIFACPSDARSCAFQITLRKNKEIPAERSAQIFYGSMRLCIVIFHLPYTLFAAVFSAQETFRAFILKKAYGHLPASTLENEAALREESRVIMPAGLWRFAQTALPPILLGMIAASEAGTYAAATKLFWAASVIPLLWGQSLVPTILAGGSWKRPAFIIAAYGFIIASFGFSLAPYATKLFYGEAFLDASRAAAILFLGLPAFCVLPLLEAELLRTKMDLALTRNAIFGNAAGLVCTVSSCFFLGGVGCATGVVVGFWAAAVLNSATLCDGKRKYAYAQSAPQTRA